MLYTMEILVFATCKTVSWSACSGQNLQQNANVTIGTDFSQDIS